MKAMLKRFVKDESGLETVEWTIMAALIILAVVGVLGGLAGGIGQVFVDLAAELPAGTPAP